MILVQNPTTQPRVSVGTSLHPPLALSARQALLRYIPYVDQCEAWVDRCDGMALGIEKNVLTIGRGRAAWDHSNGCFTKTWRTMTIVARCGPDDHFGPR